VSLALPRGDSVNDTTEIEVRAGAGEPIELWIDEVRVEP
jgi:hypothetical protein